MSLNNETLQSHLREIRSQVNDINCDSKLLAFEQRSNSGKYCIDTLITNIQLNSEKVRRNLDSIIIEQEK